MYRYVKGHTSDTLMTMEHYVNRTTFTLDCSTGPEIPGVLWYGKDYWRHCPIASNLNPVHILSNYLLQMRYNVLPSILRSSKTSCLQFLAFSKTLNYSCI